MNGVMLHLYGDRICFCRYELWCLLHSVGELNVYLN